VCVRLKAHRLDGLVVQVEAEGDALVEGTLHSWHTHTVLHTVLSALRVELRPKLQPKSHEHARGGQMTSCVHACVDSCVLATHFHSQHRHHTAQHTHKWVVTWDGGADGRADDCPLCMHMPATCLVQPCAHVPRFTGVSAPWPCLHWLADTRQCNTKRSTCAEHTFCGK
jgi:hypothetical protein